MNSKIMSMTEGKTVRLILAFSLPLMIGNIFQQLYTVVDTIVVGQHLGVHALAALGAADWTVWMVIGIAQGFAQGFSILIAQKFGAGEKDNLRKVVTNTVVISAVCAVILLLFSQISIPFVLNILHTPESIRPMARLYMTILFAGVPIVMAYNVGAAILRALGDSKTPLKAMIVASLTNVVLDILFVMGFEWGIAGAAIGTISAQAVSAVYCFYKIRRIELLKMAKSDWQMDIRLHGRLMYLGLPMAFMSAMIAIGGMIVTSVVNGFGVTFIAGFTATNKIYGVLEIAAISFGYAMTTFAGQNLGAGKLKRVREGVRSASMIAVITSIVIAVLMLLFGKLILGCFISGDAKETEEAIRVAYYYLSVMSLFLPILYILFILRSTIQGVGNTVLPMASGIAEFLMRTGAAILLPGIIGANGVFYAEVLAWFGADVVLVFSYFAVMKKLERSLRNADQETMHINI